MVDARAPEDYAVGHIPGARSVPLATVSGEKNDLHPALVESDYRGAELPAGTRSVAFRLTFRAPDRTLRDAEVDAAESRLLAALERELGVRRRDAGRSRAGE